MTVSSFQTKDATGCFTIFGIPFAAMGVLMAGKALSLTTGNTPDWAQVGMHALAALAGCVVGFGLIALGIYGGKKQRAIEALRAAAPDQPWMWREDWARGVIQSNTSSTMKSAWFLAIFWNSVSFPSAYLALRAWNTGSVKDNKILAVALFPIVGVGLLIWAARETLRRIEFGKTFFTMSTVPAAVGGRLRGTIQTRFPRGAAHGVTLKLTCVNRIVSGTGDDRSTQEKILWREEQSIAAEALSAGPNGALIAVDFRLPADGLETNTNNSDNSILWLLEADASVPGVDYREIFELPVFRTKDSPAPDAHPTPFADALVARAERPANAQVKVESTASGGLMFDFSLGRNPGAALSATAFLLLWTGALWFCYTYAPIIFAVVVGLFELLLLGIVLGLWLGESKVVIESGTVQVRGGLLGFGPKHVVSCSDVTDIALKIGMQTGGASGTPYYDIQLSYANGRKLTAGSGVRSKQEAEWLVAEMKKAMGLREKAEAASC